MATLARRVVVHASQMHDAVGACCAQRDHRRQAAHQARHAERVVLDVQLVRKELMTMVLMMLKMMAVVLMELLSVVIAI